MTSQLLDIPLIDVHCTLSLSLTLSCPIVNNLDNLCEVCSYRPGELGKLWGRSRQSRCSKHIMLSERPGEEEMGKSSASPENKSSFVCRVLAWCLAEENCMPISMIHKASMTSQNEEWTEPWLGTSRYVTEHIMPRPSKILGLGNTPAQVSYETERP